MLDKYIKQREGTLVQVVPNFSGNNELVEQLIAFVHDISNNKMNEIMKHRKNFMQIRRIRENVKTLYSIFTKHPFVVSYEIFSDKDQISFNFWIPKEISEMFIKKVYNVWDGSKVKVLEKDYIDFDLEKTTFSSIKFGSHSVLPLNTSKDLSPLSHLIQHLEQLEGEDKILIQFLMKPVKNSWQADGIDAYKKFKNGENISAGKVKSAIFNTVNDLFTSLSTIFTTPDKDSKLLKKHEGKVKHEDIISKLNKKGIHMNVRIAVQSDSRERTESLMNGVVNVFKIMEGDKASYNTFVKKDLLPIQNKENFYNYMKERKNPIVTLNQKDIWVTPEIAKFVRQPDPSITSNKLERVAMRQTLVDDSLKKDTGLRMGIHSHNGKEHTIYWDMEDMDTVMRPTVVIANPGEGKTKMLMNKFLDWTSLGYGAAVIDVADGKLIDELLCLIPQEKRNDVYYLNFNNLQRPPALSDFNETTGGDREVSNLLTQMWTEFYINYFGIEDHHRSKDFIRKSAVPIFSFEGNTILEQYNMISNEEFREEFVEKLKYNKRLFRYYIWWNKFNNKPPKVKEEETKAILNKFEVIMDNEILKNIICQKGQKVPKFRELMDGRKIILIKASEGVVGYETSRILGALLLMKFWMAALSRHSQDVEDRVPFKIFCDEPQNYIAQANYVKEMLAKSRKYRLGIELYFQDPIQLEEANKGLLKLLVSMNPHLILGKMGEQPYSKFFKNRIFPLQPEEGTHLPAYHWIVSIFQEKQQKPPFIMRAVPATKEIDKVLYKARLPWINSLEVKYSTPVEDVEADIIEREMPELAHYEKMLEEEEAMLSGAGAATTTSILQWKGFP